MSKPSSSYLMESPEEAARLEMKTDAALTERLLSLAGLRDGMRALDAGAGTGAVARTMSRLVGPAGSVVAADRSRERLEVGRGLAEAHGVTNLSFEVADIELSPAGAEGGTFDFVWCRFVFEYLADPDAALRNLARSAKPGGKVVVADLDCNGTIHHPMDPELEAGLERALRALEGHFDPNAGRKLYSRFRRAGLRDIRVHVEPYHLYAGAAPAEALANWSEKLRVIRPRARSAFASDAAFDAWASLFLEALADPGVFTYSVLVLVEGVRAT